MTDSRIVRVAAVQAAPAFLDRKATLARPGVSEMHQVASRRYTFEGRHSRPDLFTPRGS